MLKNIQGIIDIELRNDGKQPETLNLRKCILASDQFTEPKSEAQIDSAIIGMIRMRIIRGGEMPSYEVLNKFIPLTMEDYGIYHKQLQTNVIEWHIDLSIKNMSEMYWQVGVGECYRFTFFVKAYRTISSILHEPPERPTPYLKPSEFLQVHKLEIAVFQDELKQVRAILKELNESYVLIHTEEKESKVFFRNMQRYIFKVHCPTTNFAMAFFWLGTKMHSVYIERKKKDNKHYKVGGKKINKKRNK
jgi:hypothetical protein